jgi:hypothetical protein
MVMDSAALRNKLFSGYLIMNRRSGGLQVAHSGTKQTGRCTDICLVRTNAHAMDGRQKLGLAQFSAGSQHPFGVQLKYFWGTKNYDVNWPDVNLFETLGAASEPQAVVGSVLLASP